MVNKDEYIINQGDWLCLRQEQMALVHGAFQSPVH